MASPGHPLRQTRNHLPRRRHPLCNPDLAAHIRRHTLVAHAVAWGPFAQCPPFPDTCDLLRGAGGVKAGFNPVGGETFFGEISGARRKIFVTVRATAEPAPAWTPAV